jgi:hypothetical protein
MPQGFQRIHEGVNDMAVMPKYYKIHTDGSTIELEPIYTELVPVVHGKWKRMKAYCTQYVCSECGDIWPDFRSDYCSSCGARMDGE